MFSHFKSIRRVQAFRIAQIENGKIYNEQDESIRPVDPDFFDKHSPYVGGWFIMYPDNYQSFCPHDSFCQGYEQLVDPDGDESISLLDQVTPERKDAEPPALTPGAPAADLGDDAGEGDGVLGHNGLPILPADTGLAHAGLESRTFGNVDRAGFRTVGDIREAFIKQLEDGNVLIDLPGIGEATAPEIEAKILNDRGPGNYLTGEVEGEVLADPDGESDGDGSEEGESGKSEESTESDGGSNDQSTEQN